MKKSLIIIIIAFIYLNSKAQNAVNNMQKYVYYKQRFLNNFIAVGNGMGESLPLDIRRLSQVEKKDQSKVHEFGIGDATLRLGWYIAVLATEYKLLNDQGLDTYQTRKELYYALEAFNRLDLNAESYFDLAGSSNPNQGISPSSDDLNGFFIRDDMPDNFIDSTYLVEDYNSVIGSPNYQNFTSTNTTSHPHLKTSSQSYIYMSGVRGEFNQYQRTPLTDDAHPYKDEMSQDQIYDLFMGLALVKKCVDPSANFNNLPLGDGTTVSLLQEAINITNRIIDRVVEDEFILKNQSTHFQGQCTVTPNECANDLTSWGCEHNCIIGDGSNLRALGYGAVKAASYITGRSVANIYGNQLWMMPSQQAIWNLLGSVEAIALMEIVSQFNSDPKHEYKFMTALAAVGGEWENASISSVVGVTEFLSDLYYNPDLALDPDNYFVEAFGSIPFGFSINLVEPRMRFFTNEFASNEIEYLIYCFLHNDSPNWTGEYTIDFEGLMNQAPCFGPNYYGNLVTNHSNSFPPNANIHWSKPSRWKSGYSLLDHSDSDEDNGEYSGLDYMLLFNMYCLLNPSYVSYNFNSNVVNIPDTMNYPFLLDLPFGPVSYLILASNTYPAVQTAFESISSAASVSYVSDTLYGDITYKAGKQIHLKSGFNVQKGAKFHAVVEPITCDNTGQYRSVANKIIWENAGEDHPIPLSSKIAPATVKSNKPVPKKVSNNSIFKPSNDYKISVFPNPSRGIFTISISDEAIIKQVQLFDFVGHIMDERKYKTKQISMDYSEINKGSYLLKITDGSNQVHHKKIIIE